MNAILRDPNTITKKVATLRLTNSNSAMKLNQQLIQAAIECYIRTPELHLLQELTLETLCLWAPKYVFSRHGIVVSITDLEDDKIIAQDCGQVVLLSQTDMGNILREINARYQELQSAIVAERLSDLYHTQIISDAPDFYAYSLEADMKKWAGEYLHILGDPIAFLTCKHEALDRKLWAEVKEENASPQSE